MGRFYVLEDSSILTPEIILHHDEKMTFIAKIATKYPLDKV